MKRTIEKFDPETGNLIERIIEEDDSSPSTLPSTIPPWMRPYEPWCSGGIVETESDDPSSYVAYNID